MTGVTLARYKYSAHTALVQSDHIMAGVLLLLLLTPHLSHLHPLLPELLPGLPGLLTNLGMIKVLSTKFSL